MMKWLLRGLAITILGALFAMPALAKSGAVKYARDYSDVRGVNYTPASNQDSGKG